MNAWFRQQIERRPWWMNVLMLWCAYMAFIYVPWDFFIKPVAHDEEVWLGITLYGWAAKLTEPLHWAIYLAGAYGFWRMRPWMWPWSAVYMEQVAVAMLVWNLRVGHWFLGLLCFAIYSGVAYALWQARAAFEPRRSPLRERYGDWALITGASSGIGAEFARAFGREGISCVLTARREERLQGLADELQRAFGVMTRVVPVDLEKPDGAEQLLAAITDLEIAVLVNNAGFGYAGRFDKQDLGRLQAMVQLNCVAPLVLTRRLLPAMQARGRGAVIITGSIAGAQPVPLNCMYSATKAFDRYFGEGLWGELQGSGVDVLVLEPGPTETEFQVVAGESAHGGEPPAAVVAVALDVLGRQPSIISGWMNWLRASSTRLAPRSLVVLIAGAVMSQWTPPEMQ